MCQKWRMKKWRKGIFIKIKSLQPWDYWNLFFQEWELNSILPYLQVMFSYVQKTQYPVDDLKSDIDELFSLCFEHMEIISSNSHEEFCGRTHSIQSNTLKEIIVAQFQATDRLNDLPQELMSNILARVILQRVVDKIIASVDNLISLLPRRNLQYITYKKTYIHTYIHTLLY